MNIKDFMNQLESLSVHQYVGVPDSTLKDFCDELNLHVPNDRHFVTVNEGAAVGLASGFYLGEGTLSCVYMQNSGMGNAINPIASLIHQKVYDIPMLFLIGYRGEPGKKDEPQHKFQGEITLPLLDCLEINHATIKQDTNLQELQRIIQAAKKAIEENRQYAIVITKDTFSSEETYSFDNHHSLKREEAIEEILKHTCESDIVVSTTGKISREVYEQCDQLFHNHERAFLTVGSMGHASMIALGIALKNPTRQVYCIDGDGAALMHMGSMAFIAQQHVANLTHIVLNNEAHESVGGMPTNCQGVALHQVAKACGYASTTQVDSLSSLHQSLITERNKAGSTFIEVMVSLGARADLGRPKETAVENKIQFMKHIKESRN